MYSAAADIVVFLHFLWVLFLIFGALWGARNRLVRMTHISGLAFAAVLQVFGWFCPLTHLEVRLRSQHDPRASYPGSFIIHYLEKVVYLDLSPPLLDAATAALVFFNLAVYAWTFRKRAERMKK